MPPPCGLEVNTSLSDNERIVGIREKNCTVLFRGRPLSDLGCREMKKILDILDCLCYGRTLWRNNGMWKISMYDPEYKRIRHDAEALNFGQAPKLSSVKMEQLLKAVAAAIKVERAAGAVVETKKNAEEKARSETEEALNKFFAATKVTDDLIGQAAMEAEMRLCEIPDDLKNHIETLAIAMGKQRI
jgi:hypothetical protein